MGVGVVVATRNRARRLRETLGRLTRLPERPPVVVVDNASIDGTASMVSSEFPEVELIRLSRQHGPHARTIGAAALATRHVAFSDDDSWWAPGALRRAGELLDSTPRLGLLGARILVGEDGRLDPTCVEMRHSPLGRRPGLPGPSILGFVACGAVCRRDAFLAIGGFDQRSRFGGEESLVAIDLAAAGWELVYCDDIVAIHHPSPADERGDRSSAEIESRLRNVLLRRPAGRALAAIGAAAGAGRSEWRTIAGMVAEAPAILRDRRVVPRDLERRIRALESANSGR